MKFPKYDEVKSPTLRAYNRFVQMHNLRESFGDDTMIDYFNSFDEVSQKQLRLMAMYARSNGAEALKKTVIKSVEPEGYEEVE